MIFAVAATAAWRNVQLDGVAGTQPVAPTGVETTGTDAVSTAAAEGDDTMRDPIERYNELKMDLVPYVIEQSTRGERGMDIFSRLLRERMGWSKEKLQLSFQSRFGPAEWLKPYTDETVKALAASGVKRLAIITPGFAADCLETIEEIGVENRDIFLEHGGEHFARIDCLNATPEGMDVIEAVVKRELAGWV